MGMTGSFLLETTFLLKTTRAGLAFWQADENVLQRLWRWTGPLRGYVNSDWKLGNFVFSISSLVIGALALLAAVLASRYLRAFVERRMARHKYLDPGVQFTILRLVHYVVITIGVSYNADVDHVTRTLLRAAEGVQFLLEEPKPSVQFLDFGESSLNFRLLVWTDKPRRHPSIRSEINYRIRRLFQQEGIEIPCPQRDITLRGGTLRFDTDSGLITAGDGERTEEEAEARP